MPMKKEKPNMNFVLKLFKLQNWRKPRPAEAAHNIINHVTVHFALTGKNKYLKTEHDALIVGKFR